MPFITATGKKCPIDPARKRPSKICRIPAIITLNKKISNEPKSVMATSTIEVNPAAGPLTLNDDPLNDPTTIPPIIPAIKPENKGAPDAKAIPKHKGKATRKTTTEDGKSVDQKFLKFIKRKKIKLKTEAPVSG